MRRRKDFTSLIRNIERPSDKSTTIGVASSIGGDGQTINGQNFVDGEVRDLNIALPYGISSSGISGVRVQIITNDNQNNTAVGVIDKKRPNVKPGCLILYDKSGTRIILNGDGSISLNGDVYINGKLFNNNNNNDDDNNLTDRVETLERANDTIIAELNSLNNRISTLDSSNDYIRTAISDLISRVEALEYPPVIISFTVDWLEANETYHFEAVEGMTWREWCNSKYSTEDIYVTEWDTIYIGVCSLYNMGSEVLPDDVIISNGYYSTSSTWFG